MTSADSGTATNREWVGVRPVVEVTPTTQPSGLSTRSGNWLPTATASAARPPGRSPRARTSRE
jgi:hypothetical protein